MFINFNSRLSIDQSRRAVWRCDDVIDSSRRPSHAASHAASHSSHTPAAVCFVLRRVWHRNDEEISSWWGGGYSRTILPFNVSSLLTPPHRSSLPRSLPFPLQCIMFDRLYEYPTVDLSSLGLARCVGLRQWSVVIRYPFVLNTDSCVLTFRAHDPLIILPAPYVIMDDRRRDRGAYVKRDRGSCRQFVFMDPYIWSQKTVIRKMFGVGFFTCFHFNIVYHLSCPAGK